MEKFVLTYDNPIALNIEGDSSYFGYIHYGITLLNNNYTHFPQSIPCFKNKDSVDVAEEDDFVYFEAYFKLNEHLTRHAFDAYMETYRILYSKFRAKRNSLVRKGVRNILQNKNLPNDVIDIILKFYRFQPRSHYQGVNFSNIIKQKDNITIYQDLN